MINLSKQIALLLLFTATTVLAHADPTAYRFLSLHSANTPIGSFVASFPAINNDGNVVWTQGNFGSMTLMLSDGLNQTIVANAPVNFNFMSSPDLNDFGQVAINVTSHSSVVRRVYLYEADGSFAEVASALFGCGPGEFCAFNSAPSLNNAGQVAAQVTLNDNGTHISTLRIFDDNDSVEIVRQSTSAPGDVFNFGIPSINSSGSAAFAAGQIDNPGGHVFSGSGGPLQIEGTLLGSAPFPALWNDNGLIVALNGGAVLLLQGGVVIDTVINPLTSTGILVRPKRVAINNLGGIAIVTDNGAPCGGALDTGVFTGGNEIDDVVIRTGDPVLGGVVHTCGPNNQPIRMGSDAINDHGEITFLVETITDAMFVSHIVRAIPLSPLYDSEGDGVGNDMDNCLIVANPGQLDADGDGFGNICDGDLDNDGITNFTDFSVLANNFLTTDPNSDLNGDGSVNFIDIAIFAGLFLTAPGPSGLVE